MFRCHTTRSHLRAGCEEGHQVCYEMTGNHVLFPLSMATSICVVSLCMKLGDLVCWASLFIFCFHRAVFHLAIMSSMLSICSKSLESTTGVEQWLKICFVLPHCSSWQTASCCWSPWGKLCHPLFATATSVLDLAVTLVWQSLMWSANQVWNWAKPQSCRPLA